MIEKKEVKHIADLAHLGLTKKELEYMQKNFSSILDYIEILKKADVSSIEKDLYKKGINNILRKDAQKEVSKNERDELINMFPATKNNYLKTKKIL